MAGKHDLEMVSRRALFGLVAALGCVGPATVLTVSEAEAQTAGMERRQHRRQGRRERREDRREGRRQRREDRRNARRTPAAQ